MAILKKKPYLAIKVNKSNSKNGIMDDEFHGNLF